MTASFHSPLIFVYYLSCVNLAWFFINLPVSPMWATTLTFNRLVHPVLLFLLGRLCIQADVLVLYGKHGCGHPVFLQDQINPL